MIRFFSNFDTHAMFCAWIQQGPCFTLLRRSPSNHHSSRYVTRCYNICSHSTWGTTPKIRIEKANKKTAPLRSGTSWIRQLDCLSIHGSCSVRGILLLFYYNRANGFGVEQLWQSRIRLRWTLSILYSGSEMTATVLWKVVRIRITRSEVGCVDMWKGGLLQPWPYLPPIWGRKGFYVDTPICRRSARNTAAPRDTKEHPTQRTG